MPPYRVELELVVLKTLQRLQRADAQRIGDRLKTLETDPRPRGVEKLTGLNAYRIRSGDYSIVYVIDDSMRIVTVTRVAHRREVYRRI